MKEKKPRGWWTKERCREEALKYKTKTKFFKGNPSAYYSSLRNEWMDEISSHMSNPQKPCGWWTKERCQEEALKYNLWSEFSNECKGAYNSAFRNGWIEEISSHMIKTQMTPRGWWTKERCAAEAKKYNRRSEFYENCQAGYISANKNKWLDDICGHMGKPYKPHKWWTKEKCHQEALNYKTKAEFIRGSRSAYNLSSRKGWLDDICGHMLKTIEEKWTKESCRRVAENYKNRSEFCRKKRTVHIISCKNGWMDEFFPRKSKPKKSKLMNRKVKWTKEKCHQEALKYVFYDKFYKESPLAYHAACRNGWLNDICGHMTRSQKPNKWWTEERCQEEALKYKTRNEFKIESPVAYSLSLKKHYNVFDHMTDLRIKNILKDKEQCITDALKYKSRYDLISSNRPLYNKIYKNGWLDDIYKHLPSHKKPAGWWTKERCQEEALKYNSRSDFQNKNRSAYGAALKNGWLDDICGHMIRPKKAQDYYTKDICCKEAKKYKSRTDFKNGNASAYVISLKREWINDFFPK